jgi:hypothetical protein
VQIALRCLRPFAGTIQALISKLSVSYRVLVSSLSVSPLSFSCVHAFLTCTRGLDGIALDEIFDPFPLESDQPTAFEVGELSAENPSANRGGRYSKYLSYPVHI